MILRFGKNTTGRDYIIGDIHGCFSRVEKELQRIGFNPEADRLFSVGDLVDRGPESEMVLEWLDKPWFHAVRGNHEDYAIRHETVDKANWIRNGGLWFLTLTKAEQADIAGRLSCLPFVIERETAKGLVGIVHADVPVGHWAFLPDMLNTKSGRSLCLWSRDRIQSGYDGGIQGIRALVVGHEPGHEIRTLGNVIYIDTAGWFGVEGGRHQFTILDAETLSRV